MNVAPSKFLDKVSLKAIADAFKAYETIKTPAVGEAVRVNAMIDHTTLKVAADAMAASALIDKARDSTLRGV